MAGSSAGIPRFVAKRSNPEQERLKLLLARTSHPPLEVLDQVTGRRTETISAQKAVGLCGEFDFTYCANKTTVKWIRILRRRANAFVEGNLRSCSTPAIPVSPEWLRCVGYGISDAMRGSLAGAHG